MRRRDGWLVVMVLRLSSAFGLAFFLVVLCSGAVEADNASFTDSDADHGDLICHLNTAYKWGTGGNIDKSRCKGSCKANNNKVYLGYIGAIVAIVFFGSNFVPVKKYDTGDGVFFQWVLCVGIWLVGLVVNFILDSPPFYLPSVIGGVLWTTGNMLVVPIIKMIGLTMGLTVWGVSNMITGWAVGSFILHQDVTCAGLNYGGVATVIVSVVILAFVKTEIKNPVEGSGHSETTPLISEKTLTGSLQERLLQKRSSPISSINSGKITFNSSSPLIAGTINTPEKTNIEETWLDKLGVWHKRIIGFVLCLVAGPMFACLFVPVQFLKLCNEGLHSCDDMNYIFGVYSGILFTSSFYFMVYAAIRRNRPRVNTSVVFPGLISGILWGIAMCGWFMANQHLSLAISFPLVTAGPGFISSAWGILIYKEIKGWKNILLYFMAFGVTLTGLTMNGLSKCTVKC